MPGAIFHLAVLGLVRERRRTVLAMVPTAIGVVALLLLLAFNSALHTNMTENFQDALVGSVQVHHRGFFEHPRLAANLGEGAEVIAAVKSAGIERWTPRLEHFVLASAGEATSGLMLIALDPVREPRVTGLAERVTRGQFLQPGEPWVCLLGATSAKNLAVTVGDPVVLLGNDRYGAPFAEELTVAGILTSGEMGIDQGIVFVPLAAAQTMVAMPGVITNVVLRVPEGRLEPVTEQLRAQLPDSEYEVLRWSDMFPVMEEWIRVNSGFQLIFVGAVLLLIAAGVGNVALVAALAREHEFGIMLCIGTPTTGVRNLVLLESLVIGFLGTAVGLVAALAAVHALGAVGVDLAALLGDTGRYYVDPVIRPALGLAPALAVAAAVFVITQLAGIYPALRVLGLSPCEAVTRHV
jgi:ABC-type lipoprotein release transport system permease subunit